MDIGILYQKLQLVLFIVRVDGNGYGSDFGGSIKKCQPVGYIRCPDTDMGAVFDTDREHTFCHPVDTFVEFFPCKTQVAVGINQVFLVRRRFGPMFQPLA